jgi:arylsulfatase
VRCSRRRRQSPPDVPGSPNATTTIPGKQLPPPPPKLQNALVIMTDDTGFAVTSTFGGVVPTPSLARIAANGLRYTNFDSTALCSPTRAALITGRNHHSMGFGVVAEQATGFPGYDSFMTRDKATIGRVRAPVRSR